MKKFIRVFIFPLCALILLEAAGCAGNASVLAKFDRDSAELITVEYLVSGSAAQGDIARFEQSEAEFNTFFEALDCLNSITLDSSDLYSPLTSATHIITVTGGGKVLILYYDQFLKTVSVQNQSEKKGVVTIDYQYYEADEAFDGLISDFEQYARSENEVAGSVDASGLVLRASITAGEINAEGEEIDFTYLIPPPSINMEAPVYRILLPSQSSLVPEGRALIIASFGLSLSGDDAIDIEKIDITADFIRVYVSIEKGGEEGEASYPVASALVDIADLPEDKNVMFITTKAQLLSAHMFSDPIPAALK